MIVIDRNTDDVSISRLFCGHSIGSPDIDIGVEGPLGSPRRESQPRPTEKGNNTELCPAQTTMKNDTMLHN